MRRRHVTTFSDKILKLCHSAVLYLVLEPERTSPVVKALVAQGAAALQQPIVLRRELRRRLKPPRDGGGETVRLEVGAFAVVRDLRHLQISPPDGGIQRQPLRHVIAAGIHVEIGQQVCLCYRGNCMCFVVGSRFFVCLGDKKLDAWSTTRLLSSVVRACGC